MQSIYTYIHVKNYVPREYSVAAILLLLFMVLISLVSVLNLFIIIIIIIIIIVRIFFFFFPLLPPHVHPSLLLPVFSSLCSFSISVGESRLVWGGLFIPAIKPMKT